MARVGRSVFIPSYGNIWIQILAEANGNASLEDSDDDVEKSNILAVHENIRTGLVDCLKDAETMNVPRQRDE